MTWIYIIIAAVIVGLIIWVSARKRKENQDNGSGPQGPGEPPMTPGM